MRAGHAGAAQRLSVGRARDAETLHVDAGGEDVDEAAEVAEGGARVSTLVDGADGDGALGGGRGVIGS